MTNYVFTGDYQTHVTLPDGSIVTVDPGEIVPLDFDKPGPLWAGPRTNIGKAAAAAFLARQEAAEAAEAAAAAAAAEATAASVTPDEVSDPTATDTPESEQS